MFNRSWRLRWSVVALAFVSGAPTVTAQDEAPFEGRYRLYKFGQAIGEERYTVTTSGDGTVLRDTFLFTDRGSAVPLETTFTAARDGSPRRLESKGRVSRMAPIDATIAVDGSAVAIRQGDDSRRVAVTAPMFTMTGYSPVAMQDAMLRYWLSHGSPALLPLQPTGTQARIRRRGVTTVTVEGRQDTLTRYSVSGLIWGQEILWLDRRNRLVALVSTDAEFDHFEATADGYHDLLPQFVAEAAADGMAVLAELGQGLRLNATGPLAIVGATLVDGTGAPSVRDAVIVIDNGRIVAAGPRDTVSIPAGATRFDATGKTVLPGLWDMHAHVQQVEWGPVYLAAGVTTARDAANEMEFIAAVRDALRNGKGLGPRLLLAGVVDGTNPAAMGLARVDTETDAARWVREYKLRGFDQMKIYGSVTRDMVAAVSRAAHAAGMTVTGHVPNALDVYQAVDAGLDQINHLDQLMTGLSPKPKEAGTKAFLESHAAADLDGESFRKLAAFLKERKTVIDPTLALFEMLLHPSAQPADRFEPGLAKVAPELRAPLRGFGLDANDAAAGGRTFRRYVELVGKLHAAGIPIVAGTDQVVPGHSLHRELELYVQAGLTPLQAIQSATVVPARVMGLDRDVGTIAPGLRADLIVLDANPLADIRNIRTVRWVMANGVMYPTAGLWESIGFTP